MTSRYIEFSQATLAAPSGVREEARARFQELLESIGEIPASSVFWQSMQASRLSLVVRGWTFLYTLDGEALRVEEVRGKSG